MLAVWGCWPSYGRVPTWMSLDGLPERNSTRNWETNRANSKNVLVLSFVPLHVTLILLTKEGWWPKCRGLVGDKSYLVAVDTGASMAVCRTAWGRESRPSCTSYRWPHGRDLSEGGNDGADPVAAPSEDVCIHHQGHLLVRPGAGHLVCPGCVHGFKVQFVMTGRRRHAVTEPQGTTALIPDPKGSSEVVLAQSARITAVWLESPLEVAGSLVGPDSKAVHQAGRCGVRTLVQPCMGIPVRTAGGPWWVGCATLRKKQLDYGDMGQFCRNWMLGNVQGGRKLPFAAPPSSIGSGVVPWYHSWGWPWT
jgi:hypothetical protein